MTATITFKQATQSDKPLISIWWAKPHVMEFWDNSPEMWENVANYLDKGIVDLFDYWIGYTDDTPFALVMTCNESKQTDHPDHYKQHLTTSEEGEAISFDFMIGEEEFLGKGLGHRTLKAFMDSCPKEVTRFLIEPAADNPRALHVYEKAGFVEVGRSIPAQGYFAGKEHIMMMCERS